MDSLQIPTPSGSCQVPVVSWPVLAGSCQLSGRPAASPGWPVLVNIAVSTSGALKVLVARGFLEPPRWHALLVHASFLFQNTQFGSCMDLSRFDVILCVYVFAAGEPF